MVGLGWLVSKPLVGTADGQNRRKTKRRQPTSPRRVRRFAASLASSSCLPRRNAAIKSWHHYLTGFPSFSSLSGDLFAHRIHFPMGDGGATDVGCLALLSLFVMIFPSTLSIRGPWLCSMINFLRPTVLRACTLTHLAYDSTRPFMWWMNVTCATATCGNACPPFAFIPPGGWCQNTPVFVEDDRFLGSFSSFLFYRSNSKLQCRRCQKTSDRSLIQVGRRVDMFYTLLLSTFLGVVVSGYFTARHFCALTASHAVPSAWTAWCTPKQDFIFCSFCDHYLLRHCPNNSGSRRQ